MSLTSIFSIDGMLRTAGAAEEDIEAFRVIRNTVANATWGLITRIYNEYRALTPEQRTAIRQNLIQGARQLGREIHNAATNEDIQRALRTLAAPPMPQEALPGNTTHHSSIRIEGYGIHGYDRYVRGNTTTPRSSVTIEELEGDESVSLPPQRAITQYTPPSTRPVVPSINNEDAALALALQVSAEEHDAQLQAALQASLVEIQRSYAPSSSFSSSSAQPPTANEEGQKFKPRSAKRPAPEKPSKLPAPTYDGEGSDDPEFKKAMEEALAESLKQGQKKVTHCFDHKNTSTQRKDDRHDQDDQDASKSLSTKRRRNISDR